MIAKVDAKQPAQMRAEDRDDQAAPVEIAGHDGQQGRHMVGADSENIEPIEMKRHHARGQHQPFVRCNRRGTIGSGQYRGLRRWPVNCRHREVGIPLSAPDAVIG